MKKFQRMKQQASEALGRGEKTDKLTQKLAVVEKKVDGIRSAVQITTKKLSGTILGAGSTLEKHQRKLPQYSLGAGMMEHGSQLGTSSLFGSVLMMVGQAQQDIASQMANYEITIGHEIISVLNNMLEEDTKPVDKCKKKLNNARLDMDSARTRLRNFEQQIERSSREYNMEKLTALKTDVDDFSRKFEECQDAYATSMYEFISKEQEYTDKIQQLVKLQITHYKNAAVQLEGMLPVFLKKMNETQDRPVFGLALEEHLRISKREISAVLETCCNGLREWMTDTEGLFRIAGGQAKIKFLKTAFDAGQFDVSTHDPHTIGGCLKMYLRELPEPLLTYDLYDEWMKAAGVADEQLRLTNLWNVKEKLPEANLKNFRYLCAFLNEFSQYSDATKMSVGNIAIVIGPNLLWPREENSDPANMVTETAIQRRIAEMFIEHCHHFFPDLPETPSKVSSPSSLTFTSPSPISFNSTILQSYTTKASESFSGSTQSADSVSISSTGSGDGAKPKEELPHPLAESAIDEGVTVNLVEGNISPKVLKKIANTSETIRTPKPVPPVPAPRTNSSNNLTPPESPSFLSRNPPSPAPRKHNFSSVGPNDSTPVSLRATENGKTEDRVSPLPAKRPIPPVRAKRGSGLSTPPTPTKPPPYSPSGSLQFGSVERRGSGPGTGSGSGSGTLERKATSLRGPPNRKAPPPPKSKKSTDELTSL